MRKFLFYVVALVLGVVGVVAAIGWWLPVAHNAARTLVLAAPPEVVFDIVTDFPRHPEWRSDLTRIETSGEPGLGQSVREFGSSGELPYRVAAYERPTRLVTRIESAGMAFGGAWTYYLAATPEGGTRLTIAEDGEVYNVFFRFMSRFVFGHEATIDRYLADLAPKVGQ